MAAPTPPFTRETAIAKIRMAEDAWNSRDPHRVCLACAEDSQWRNRAEFINGRAEIVAFLIDTRGLFVIPANAGIQGYSTPAVTLDPRFRGGACKPLTFSLSF